jgi:hypothetical protein
MTEEERERNKAAVKKATDEIYKVVLTAFEKYYTNEVRGLMLLSVVAGDEIMRAGMLDAFSNGALAILSEAIDYHLLITLESSSDKVQ